MTTKELRKELKRRVAQYTVHRDRRCVTCGETDMQKLTNGHLFTCYGDSTKYDIADDGNCHAQCLLCNGRHENEPWHYEEWYKGMFGEKAYERLWQRHHRLVKFTRADLEDKLKEVENKTKEVV